MELLVGLDDANMAMLPWQHGDTIRVHSDVIAPLKKLRKQLASAGFNLGIASGYRNYQRQLAIWNQKASGERAVLDDNGKPLKLEELSKSKEQLVFAILRWSALPGASRHHWGTDVDVYDGGVVNSGYELKLEPAEYHEGGVFEAFYQAMKKYVGTPQSDFYFPYAVDNGGIAPEPWHISYRPLANQYMEQLDYETLRDFIDSQTSLALRETVLEHFSEIYQRFVAFS